MKNKILITVIGLLVFLSHLFMSCDKKQHEIILNVEGDTTFTTFHQIDTIVDTVLTIEEHTVFINLNDEEVKDVFVSINENTVNNTEVLLFTNNDVTYSLVSGEGFIISGDQLLVSNEDYLDFESRREILLEVEASSQDTIKMFNVLVVLKDVVDISALKAHFDFDQQNLIDHVSGNALSLTGDTSYNISLDDSDNYTLVIEDNQNTTVLEWSNKIIDVNEDFSICFFADHKFKSVNQQETFISGYDSAGMPVIRLFFEDIRLRVSLNGTVVSDLEYSFNDFNGTTVARSALIKEGDQYSIRINNNGVGQVVDVTVLNEVVNWSIGADKNVDKSISNGYTGKIDNIRFYQHALTETEYNSVISVDF